MSSRRPHEYVLVRVLVSVVAIGAAVIHVVLPQLTIDATTLILLAVAALPWLLGVIESAEFPGGWKLKFRNLEQTAQRAQSIGLASESLSASEQQQYLFQLVGLEDPNLALAGLRIEIERRLKRLAEKHDIGTKMQGIGSLLNTLYRRDLIGQEERSIISDMIALLNGAVHGARVDQRAAAWAMDFGPRLLKALDERTGG